jgi:hypothetical protein
MKQQNSTNQIVETMRNTKGRFFGLYTKNGRSLNARFIQDTPSYVTVFDRNTQEVCKFSKKNLSGLYFQGRAVGVVF